MQINVTYESSVANAPADFTAAFNAAVQYFESLIQNPVTVNINVGWGEVQGTALASNALAENIETWQGGYSYQQVVAALDAANSLGASSLPASDPTNGAQFTMTSAQAKALGLIDPSAATTDGWIGFSSNANYDFDTNPSDPVSSGTYDLFGIALHELSQVLGRQITEGAGDQYTPMDLYHFSAPGVRDLNAPGGYFSVDDGATDINNFNVNPNWGDPGDWTNATVDDFDLTTYPGEPMPLSAGDLTVMQSLGWNLSAQSDQPTMTSYSLSGTEFFNGTGGYEYITGGSTGNETVWGGASDHISANGANMTVGGAQNETIVGGTGTDFLDGSVGDDSIVGGNAGTEMIWSGKGDIVDGGGDANDTVGGVPGDTVIGGNGSEFIDGSSGNQVIAGGASGNDTIWGGAGDTIYGGGNANVVIGGGPHDTITGGTGTELLSGWLGDQEIIGGSAGNETLTGAIGDTVVGGSGGTEFIDATAGNQEVTGGTGGNEIIWGGAGDTISGGGDANETIGGVAWDTIAGGSGSEFIDGSAGQQVITAGSGNEMIWGGAGDTITGGSGNATIGLGGGGEFLGADFSSRGADTVIGFSVTNGDQIILPSATANAIEAVLATASTAGGATTISFGNGATLTLAGITHLDAGFFS